MTVLGSAIFPRSTGAGGAGARAAGAGRAPRIFGCQPCSFKRHQQQQQQKGGEVRTRSQEDNRKHIIAIHDHNKGNGGPCLLLFLIRGSRRWRERRLCSAPHRRRLVVFVNGPGALLVLLPRSSSRLGGHGPDDLEREDIVLLELPGALVPGGHNKAEQAVPLGFRGCGIDTRVPRQRRECDQTGTEGCRKDRLLLPLPLLGLKESSRLKYKRSRQQPHLKCWNHEGQVVCEGLRGLSSSSMQGRSRKMCGRISVLKPSSLRIWIRSGQSSGGSEGGGSRVSRV